MLCGAALNLVSKTQIVARKRKIRGSNLADLLSQTTKPTANIPPISASAKSDV